jgi:hypothetical protein
VVSLVLAFPVEMVVNAPAGALLVVALLPALRPRGALVTTVIFIAVLGWMITTGLYVEPITVWRLAALAGALYLLHTTAALASVLPYDTVVAPGVLLGWLLRAGVVVVLTAGFTVAVMLGVLPIGGGRSFLIASIVGLAVMASIASLLAYLRRR